MKTVIEMAEEAGFETLIQKGRIFGNDRDGDCTEELERFAALVRADERNSWPAEMEAMERQVNILTDALAQAKADEREACAKAAQDFLTSGRSPLGRSVADAIRARSNT